MLLANFHFITNYFSPLEYLKIGNGSRFALLMLNFIFCVDLLKRYLAN